MVKNTEIRAEAKNHSVRLWEIADRFGMNDGNFSRKLRHELTPEDKQKIRTIIHDIAKDRGRS